MERFDPTGGYPRMDGETELVEVPLSCLLPRQVALVCARRLWSRLDRELTSGDVVSEACRLRREGRLTARQMFSERTARRVLMRKQAENNRPTLAAPLPVSD